MWRRSALRSLGLKTAIVEREHLGGICLNWGCIPTKALLRSAEILHFAEHAKDYGLKLEGTITADISAVVARSRGVSARLNGGIGYLMKKNKVDVIWGEAKLTKPGEIIVSPTKKAPMQPQIPAPKGTLGEGTYTAKHIILATGARPRALPGIEPDGKLIWTYFEAMVPQAKPKSMLVMGSGAIGIEFASFYNAMGVDVTVVELLPNVMPVEDVEISTFRPEDVGEIRTQDHHGREGHQSREGRGLGDGHGRDQGRQVLADYRRQADLRRRRAGKHRKPRP